MRKVVISQVVQLFRVQRVVPPVPGELHLNPRPARQQQRSRTSSSTITIEEISRKIWCSIARFSFLTIVLRSPNRTRTRARPRILFGRSENIKDRAPLSHPASPLGLTGSVNRKAED